MIVLVMFFFVFNQSLYSENVQSKNHYFVWPTIFHPDYKGISKDWLTFCLTACM